MSKKIALTVSGLLLALVGIFFYVVRDTDEIYKNVMVYNIDLSNMSKNSAKDLVSDIKLGSIKLNYNGKEFLIPEEKISYKVNSDAVIEQAYNTGKSEGFLNNKLKIFNLRVLGKKQIIPLQYTLDEVALKEELEKIASEIDIKETDAKITIQNEQMIVTQEVNGERINIAKTLDIVKDSIKYSKHENIELVTEVTIPKVTKEKLETIDTLLGEYSTTFNAGAQGRSHNVRLSAEAINDVLLQPQEILSFNNSTGERSAANGYRNAPVIENGEMVEGLGGGVCQVSSTLFNAAALSGLKVVERRNHSIPSSYVALGRDAVVDYGSSLDLKMQNEFKNPVYIVANVEGNKINVKVYGSKSDKADEVKIYAVVHGSIPRKTKTVKSGKATNGRDGIKATTYRVIVKNGSENKEVLSSNYYPAKTRVVVAEAPKPSSSGNSAPSPAPAVAPESSGDTNL